MSVPQNVLRGILLMLCAVLLFASMDATAKWLAAKYPVPMLVWARYVVHCLLMLIFLLPSHGRGLWRTTKPAMQIARALMLLGITAFTMFAFRLLPLTVATAIAFLAPLLVGLLAGPVLGEKVGRIQFVALFVGLAGVVLIARPGGDVSLAGVFLAGMGALCYTVYQLMTRMLAPYESSVTMLFFTALVGSLVMTALLPWIWTEIRPDAFDAFLIGMLGVLGGSGHYLLIRAFRVTPAATLAPFIYAQMVWAGLLDLVVFQHVPDGPTWTGIALIVAAGLSVVVRERLNARSAPNLPADRSY
ncbi:MAG: DMT family transporter [Rhodocyclaceae bacterium]|nr:DMT family transporter [Rhodocyclaceae bacterium]